MTLVFPTYFLLVILGFYYLNLASWRLSSLLMQEDGPFKIFHNLRIILGVKEEWEDDEELGFFHNLLTCIRCTSMWASAFLVLLCLTGFGSVLVAILGSSGAAIKYDD